MLKRDPHFFLHSGDSIYADGPITGDVTLPDGRIYRNVVEEVKTHVAETLADFRGAYKYNLGDAGMREFLARTSMVCQWDDHEVSNNWYPGEILDNDLYTEKNIDVLKVRAYRAWTEYQPLSPRTVSEHQIYRKARTVRCWTSSSWTCGPTATPTRPIWRPVRSARRAASSAPSRPAGWSARWNRPPPLGR